MGRWIVEKGGERGGGGGFDREEDGRMGGWEDGMGRKRRGGEGRGRNEREGRVVRKCGKKNQKSRQAAKRVK